MQVKSFFLVKNQQVVSWRNGKGRGLTGNVRVIVWNYEENGPGSGDFFETPVKDLLFQFSSNPDGLAYDAGAVFEVALGVDF